ncbi:hypothetical protein BV20DRAFT_1118375 [Pilatotrama ljubarskyi]|nr:hypothetical protein BV20DRAFT_1118375 [Pilatotrama ljubarskyi]
MRSPVLAFSLLAAAAVSVSAQSNVSPDLPLSPDLQGNAGLFHVKNPREYQDTAYPYAANSRGHPEPPSLGPDHGGMMLPRPAGDLDGGTSNSAPAVGGAAGDGGGSTTTTDGDPASGADLVNKVGNQIFHTATGDAQKGHGQSEISDQESRFAYKSTPGYAYEYHRMRRVVRTIFSGSGTRRDESLLSDEGELGLSDSDVDSGDNGNDNDSSGQDGPDGVSQRGSERDGRGPNGGHAHSGEVGSSEGGHVYNIPASE